MQHHDLIVIGTGSGNMVIDDSFADCDVALVEERKVGGTCVNYGCIPSKMLAYTAEVADTVTGADTFGVDAELRALRGLRCATGCSAAPTMSRPPGAAAASPPTG